VWRRILQKHRSAILNQKYFTLQITQDCKDAGIDTLIPNTLHETLLVLTQVRKEMQESDQNSSIVSQIFYLHSKKKQVLPDHVDYLFLSNLKHTVRTATIKFLCNWLHLYESAIQESIHIAHSNAVKNTPSFRTYFRSRATT
jgi:hypothetical protein